MLHLGDGRLQLGLALVGRVVGLERVLGVGALQLGLAGADESLARGEARRYASNH